MKQLNIKRRSNINNYRFDSRDKQTFSSDIKRSTLIEKWLMSLWIQEMRDRGNTVDCIDNGVDNTGEFVDVPSSLPDYKVIINGVSNLYEIKTSPIGNNKKSSFKVDSLKAAIKYNAELLVFYNIATRSSDFKNDTDLSKVYWYQISVPMQQRLLAIYEVQKIPHIMGGKPIIVIPLEHYYLWFTKEVFKGTL